MVIPTVTYDGQKPFLSEFVLKEYMQNTLNEALIWSKKQNWIALLNPLLCGVTVAIFSFMLVYLDSNLPGVNPPLPFTSRTKSYQQKNSGLHLSYITALAAGLVISILMYSN